MTAKPYTDADVKLVEHAILHAEPPIRPGYINGPAVLTAEARAALDALAAAGRLASGPCPCTCHQPDRCPCTPGTPQHKHGAGGYCLVGDSCTCPDHDVSTLADEPGTRTVKGLDPACPVHRGSVEQAEG